MPVYFLWGDEDFLIEKRTLEIKKKALGEDINELNFRSVDNPSFALFSELLRTNPMMFGNTVIQIKCPKYFLESKNKEKLDEKQTKELTEALSNVSDMIHIILICPTPRGEKKKPDSRKKLYKELVKITKPEEFPSYKSYEEYKLIPVIKKLAKELSLKINDSESSLIVQTTGTSLRDISNHLEKIKLYIHPNDVITKKAVEETTTNTVDIYNLVDLILAKDYASSLNLISNLLQKEHYLLSLAFIQTVFSNLLKIKLYSKLLSSYDIAIKLNMNEYIVKKNMEKLSPVSLDELIRLKINLTEVEYKLKTGTIKDPILAYELAFIEDKVGG